MISFLLHFWISAKIFTIMKRPFRSVLVVWIMDLDTFCKDEIYPGDHHLPVTFSANNFASKLQFPDAFQHAQVPVNCLITHGHDRARAVACNCLL